MAILLFLLQWLKLRFIVINHYFEIYVGFIALIFTGLGIWLALKLARPNVRTVVVERAVTANHDFVLNEEAIARLGLSNREMDVLQLMAEGLSNQEIAARLFVSLNTVKTHTSRVFEKMEVKRRTQAVDKAKKMGILPR
ncbi:response regulator transcription factor [Parapedobacter sp. DT-150]|uniref:response regulator transcription factor n=1 Tax=Parapedobacter sp. DT-150 TaxID=3396162 RepID=UPI003F1E0970